MNPRRVQIQSLHPILHGKESAQAFGEMDDPVWKRKVYDEPISVQESKDVLRLKRACSKGIKDGLKRASLAKFGVI